MLAPLVLVECVDANPWIPNPDCVPPSSPPLLCPTHLVHIHLIDFYIVARDNDPSKVPLHERRTSKDVMQTYNSANIVIAARSGAGSGAMCVRVM